MKYFINTNPYADKDLVKRVCEEAVQIFENHGYYSKAEDPLEADVALSVGGDGTLIDTANMVGNQTNIIGVNAGRLGYLAEVEPGDVRDAIIRYFHGDCHRQERMRISAAYDGVQHPEVVDALNDIVISKGQSSVIDVEICVDGKKMTSYYADGIIVSTPTGSTGYAFSCGAPIVSPESALILITPVAAHSLVNRSIIVPASSSVSITVKDERGCGTIKIACDGKEDQIRSGSTVHIQRSGNITKIVKFSEESFCDRIINKMKGV